MRMSHYRYVLLTMTALALTAIPVSASSAALAAAASKKHVIIAQWASSAKATSQYGSPGWAASQATHAPNTKVCGDNSTAWASKSDLSVDTLTVGYKVPVVPKLVKIYESYNAGQVTNVQVVDVKGAVTDVYTAAPAAAPACPFVLKVPITGVTAKVKTVRITVDQSVLRIGWNEIDAVQLVGRN
jgi:hypothetical protein